MATNQAIYSDLPIPPGEYLEEVIEELGMSKDELAWISTPTNSLRILAHGSQIPR